MRQRRQPKPHPAGATVAYRHRGLRALPDFGGPANYVSDTGPMPATDGGRAKQRRPAGSTRALPRSESHATGGPLKSLCSLGGAKCTYTPGLRASQPTIFCRGPGGRPARIEIVANVHSSHRTLCTCQAFAPQKSENLFPQLPLGSNNRFAIVKHLSHEGSKGVVTK